MSDATNAAGKANFNPSGLGFSGSGTPSNWSAAGGANVYKKGNFGIGVGAGVEGSRTKITGPQAGVTFSWKF